MNIKNIETFLSDSDNLDLILNHNYKDLWVRFESEYRVSASDLMIVLFHSAIKAHNLSVFTWDIQFVCAFIISYQAVCLAFPLGVFFQVGSDGNLPIIILNSFGS